VSSRHQQVDLSVLTTANGKNCQSKPQ